MRCTLSWGRLFVALSAMLLLFGNSARLEAENWPSWRGPTGNGISTEKGIPVQWDRKTNVAWRLALPGPAGATPVVWEDRIFLTSVDENELVLLCVNTKGKQLWRRTVGYGNKNVRNDEGNSASNSPVTDGKHVWSMMANGAIACFTVDGKQVWKLNVQDRYGRLKIAFGLTSTPVLEGNRLFLQLIHGDGKAATQEAMVVALDKRTGEELWKQDRVTGASSENEHAYSSPLLYDDGKLKYLVTHGADYTIAYNLEDGSERWRLGGLNPHDDPNRKYHPTLRFVASPTAVPGMIVIPTAKRGPVFAIRPDAKGDLTNNSSAHLWTRERDTPDVPCPLIHDGIVYLCREKGQLLCLDAKTGKELYSNILRPGVRHRASPVYADGKIYLTGRGGVVRVVKTGPTFNLLATNDLQEEMAASPVISNGTLYLRSFDALWAIRTKN